MPAKPVAKRTRTASSAPERPTSEARRRRPTPTALALAEHGEAPVHLDAPQRTLLGEALRRGEDLREQLESTVTSYGRWILGAVFRDDAAAALDDRSKNPVWLELVRRAGGPSLRISRRILYVAVQVAARDKRITDAAPPRHARAEAPPEPRRRRGAAQGHRSEGGSGAVSAGASRGGSGASDDLWRGANRISRQFR